MLTLIYTNLFEINFIFFQEEILAPVGKGQENKKVKVKLNGGQDVEDVSMEKVLGKSYLEEFNYTIVSISCSSSKITYSELWLLER